MLKKKFSIIALLFILIVSLTLPIVRAENETDEGIMPINEQGSSNEEVQANPNSEQDDSNFKNGDVYLFGDNITIDYIVDGNLFVFANSVTINSQIGGDAFICAKTITVSEQGYIFSNLFALAETVNVNGVIYDLYSCSQTTNISGYVYRDIKVASETLNILGTIKRNAFVECNNITIGNQSENSDDKTPSTQGGIGGDLNYTAKNELTIPKEAVNGNINFTPKVEVSTNTLSDKILSLGSFIATVVLIWLVLLWLAPKFVKTCDKMLIKKPLPVIGIGLITPFVFLFGFVVLLLLSITASFSLLAMGLLFILLLVSSSIFVITINNLICNKLKIEKVPGILGILIISSAVLWLLKLIPIVGGLISFISVVVGLGIIISCLIFKSETTESNKDKKLVNETKTENKE